MSSALPTPSDGQSTVQRPRKALLPRRRGSSVTPRRRGRLLKVIGSVVAGLLVLAIGALVVLGYGAKLVDFHRVQLSNSVKGDFQQLSFTDPSHGNVTLKYNLYVPKNYDPTKKYPIVLFMHDSSVVSSTTTNTLGQYGAAEWATSSSQAANPAFVLAPQYQTVTTTDAHVLDAEGEATVPLLKHVMSSYSIDTNRVYATGQSMGAMMTMALNIEYPHLFAASLIVAGQWTKSVEAPLTKQNILYVVSGGDAKAKPGMTDFEDVLKQQGVTPAKAYWDGRWSQDQYTEAANDLFAQNRHVNLVTFAPRTVTPVGACINMAALEHIYTWDHAYQIDALRTWLFSQRKPAA